ncbi:hypothetical protein D8M04_13605 [Oceanobacillus piezotolerans]|uniref:Uncharacterized protein n=1 Tax=Oceanobacillus piezotolerans TaxID=2448030 RepID=A0A498D5N1_9BACI|nr:hypothetical protein [Oceanobacillus piezotolerans]RLL43933.1 hypothetical protein D8M04_13605 [Oceanobacillus piezotolerans]
MRLHIYSLQETTYESFLSFIDQSLPFKIHWYPLNEEVTVEGIPHFSIFLLSIQGANSIWLMQHIEKLKNMGAHDQNFYFVLYNKESAPRQSDIELVVEDLHNNLSEMLVKPMIDTISIRAYDAFVQGESRFLYFDDILNEHRTIKQLETSDSADYLNFQKYIGKRQVEIILEEWSRSPFLLFWKKSNLKTLLVYDVPEVVVSSLLMHYNFNLITASNEDEFLKIQQDKEIISITSTDHDEATDLLPNQFILSNSCTKSTGNKLYFNEEVYTFAKLPVENIIEKEDLVFLDAKGYPKPKSKIKDWDTEIANISGLKTVINRVGACIQ